MLSKTGKLIVIYGINNLGKTTQAKLLATRLEKEGNRALYVKCPAYDLAPSGPLIDGYLRRGNPYNLSPREFQIIYALNRTQFEPTLKTYLAEGITVVMEDYSGSGIAWGTGAGVDHGFLVYINRHLLKEDFAFLFDGERFVDATEKGHMHEANDILTERVRAVHRELVDEYGWHLVHANDTQERIHEKIWNIVKPIL